MAGTKIGGQKAAAKNKAKNPNFYSDIGKIGGKNGHTGGFAANPELARIAGRKGGQISRRKKMTEPELAIAHASLAKARAVRAAKRQLAPVVEHSPVKRPLWKKIGSYVGL